MKCRYCGSDNLKFSKWITWGPIMGNGYHYKINCLNCKKHYHVARSSEVFELVKDQPWQMSNVTKKHIAKEMNPKLL